MAWLSHERYSQELISETLNLAKAVAEADPGAIVPNCPEWTTRDLVTHVGTGHRLATELIENAAQGREVDGTPSYRLVPAPDDQAEWADWLMDGAERMVVAIEAYGFDGPVWTWHPEYQTAGFWLRRMLHDEIIHRFDGQASEPLAPDLAADGVDDFLLTFAVEALEYGTDAGRVLGFRATDAPYSWRVTLLENGLDWERGGDDSAVDVTVEAPVTELLLIMNRRREAGGDQVSGDAGLFDRWRDLSRF